MQNLRHSQILGHNDERGGHKENPNPSDKEALLRPYRLREDVTVRKHRLFNISLFAKPYHGGNPAHNLHVH